MKYFLTIVIMIACLRVDVVAEPAWLLWGDPQNVQFDEQRQVYLNGNTAVETWRFLTSDPELRKELLKPEEVPVQKTFVLVFRCPKGLKPEDCYAAIFAGTQSRKNRFVLINVEQTANYERQYRVWPHLGVLYVGTAVHQQGWDVVLWDELVQGHVSLEELVEPGDIVGLSLVVTGIERGLELARQAKSLGARYVIAGNDSAIFRSNQILRLPGKPIDAVFTSNSLTAVRRFFRAIEYGEIGSVSISDVETEPIAVQRSNERQQLYVEIGQRNGQRRDGTFDNDDVFVVPQFDLFPASYWNEVWSNYREVFGHKHSNPETVKNAIALFAQGCTRTKGKDACTYCSIAGVADVRVPSEQYLRATVEAYQRFGIDAVFNTTDSAYEMKKVVDQLQNVGARFKALTIYGRAQGITEKPELLDEWQKVVNDRLLINVGMDSGDSESLHAGIIKSSLKTGSRVSENHLAVRYIAASDAHLHYSLIFGSPGETTDSCERSIEFLEWSTATLRQQLDLVETDIFWLNYGSPAARVFHDYRYAQELAALANKSISREEWRSTFAQYAEELVVPPQAQEGWFRHFTRIDMDTAQSYNRRAAEIMARHEGGISGRAFKPS